jgi:ankyrin repeat protein
MRCPKCQFENIDDAIFCQECGNRLEVVSLLLDNGADFNIKMVVNNVEWTALKEAKEHGHRDIVQLLENAGAKE